MTPVDYLALRRLLDDGAQLVEVLPADEYAEMHLPARSISRSRPSTPPPPRTSTGATRWSCTAGTGFET